MKAVSFFLLTIIIVAVEVTSARAQDTAPQPTPVAPAEDNQSATEDQAYLLLEDVIAGAQSLKLPENRCRMEIAAADLLWKRDEGRARSLFTEAAANVALLMRQTGRNADQPFGQNQSAIQLRQELVLTAARHDAALAYQLLQTTRPPTAADAQGSHRREGEAFLEQLLLAQIAATDPDLALRKAEETLDKGEYSAALTSVLEQLQDKDKRAAARLTDKLLGRLQAENLLASHDAVSLALGLLRPGPRPTEPPPAARLDSGESVQGLSASAYQRLLETVVAVALKATPNTAGRLSGRQGGAGGGQPFVQPPLTGAQVAQNNARSLLLNLHPLLPQIERHLPTRTQAVRQKLGEFGEENHPRAGFGQLAYLTRQGTSHNLLTTALTAPPGMQGRIYQQAALKALDEGNADGARQIADDHLDKNTRGVVSQAIDAQQKLREGKAVQLEELRQTLARLTSADDRVGLLLQLADATRADNPKQAGQFLEEACGLVTRRATSYQQLENQLQVAHALAATDPARSFEVLESGINQLNELLPAAASLSGFEVHIFTDGEMSLTGNTQLGVVVARYGQELAVLAKRDFGRTLATADQFQYPEARLLARLSIVQAVLSRQTAKPANDRFARRSIPQGAPPGL